MEAQPARYGVTAVSCSHCQEKQVVHVRARTGFAQIRQQAIECLKCHEVFEVTIPDEIIAGPFPHESCYAMASYCGDPIMTEEDDARSLVSNLKASGEDWGAMIENDTVFYVERTPPEIIKHFTMRKPAALMKAIEMGLVVPTKFCSAAGVGIQEVIECYVPKRN